MPEISAYHEAGHAFIAIYVGARVRSVTVDPDWDDGPKRHGDAQIEWPPAQFTDREFCEKSILVALAGPVAEMIHSGDPFHPALVAEWAADWSAAWELAAALHANKKLRMKKVARMLKRRLKNILSWFRHPISNATAEGFNSRIQSIKSNARGFRNFANYRTRILFFCGKLKLKPC